MARVKIPYGRGEQFLEVADSRLLAVLRPRHGENGAAKGEELVKEALEHPCGSPRLRELARGKRQVVVITSDHTRPVPSRVTMPLLLQEIRSGNPEAEITILIATGMHRPTTQEELKEKLGEALVASEKIVVHEAEKEENMVFFGQLPSGGELWLNALAAQADLLVAEGFVEPHFFAGFSGGRKSILPGIASRKTVLYNHNAAFLSDPGARQGLLESNPVHRDMIYAAQRAQLAFILNVLLDSEKRICAAFAGDVQEAHEAGCRLCLAQTRVEAVWADIAITSNGGYPLDQNMYQAVKGMTAAEATVRPGGVIIICAELSDGHGGESFYRWFAERRNAQEVARDIRAVPPQETQMDQWEAQILARVMCRATCIVVTGRENRQMVEKMHLLWAPDVNAALALADGLVGAEATVTVIPDGVGVTVTAQG